MCSNAGLRLWANPQEAEKLSLMMGAICGDVAGSVYEMRNIRYKLDLAHLVHAEARCTDDSVMTCAVADGLREALAALPEDWMQAPEAEAALAAAVTASMQRYGRRYPDAGYGSKFMSWILSEHPHPYGSWGNGSAMRVSFAGWAARSLEEAERLAEISARVTHDHPEGVKGAIAVAGCLFTLRQTGDKAAAREYASRFYDLDFTLDEIRDTYTFNASCAGSVPQAIVAFLEGNSFADVIGRAIALGGDSDTIAAIAGCLAEVIYPIPQELLERVGERLDEALRGSVDEAVRFLNRG